MSRYFLNVRIRGELILDLEGSEFTTVEAARRDAILSAKELVAQDIKVGIPLSDSLDGAIEVLDADGTHVVTVPFSEGVELRLSSGSRSPTG